MPDKANYSPLLLHCCPKDIKKTLISHTVALFDMFLHFDEGIVVYLEFPS